MTEGRNDLAVVKNEPPEPLDMNEIPHRRNTSRRWFTRSKGATMFLIAVVGVVLSLGLIPFTSEDHEILIRSPIMYSHHNRDSFQATEHADHGTAASMSESSPRVNSTNQSDSMIQLDSTDSMYNVERDLNSTSTDPDSSSPNAASDMTTWIRQYHWYYLHAQATMANHLIRTIKQASDHYAVQTIVNRTKFIDSEGPCIISDDSAFESPEMGGRLPCHFAPLKPMFPQAIGEQALWELSYRGRSVAMQILEDLQNLERHSAEAPSCTATHEHVLTTYSIHFVHKLDFYLSQYLHLANSTLSAKGWFLRYRDTLTRSLIDTQKSVIVSANHIDGYLPRYVVFVYRVEAKRNNNLKNIRSKIASVNLLSEAITSMLNDLEHAAQLIEVIRREAAASLEIIEHDSTSSTVDLISKLVGGRTPSQLHADFKKSLRDLAITVDGFEVYKSR